MQLGISRITSLQQLHAAAMSLVSSTLVHHSTESIITVTRTDCNHVKLNVCRQTKQTLSAYTVVTRLHGRQVCIVDHGFCRWFWTIYWRKIRWTLLQNDWKHRMCGHKWVTICCKNTYTHYGWPRSNFSKRRWWWPHLNFQKVLAVFPWNSDKQYFPIKLGCSLPRTAGDTRGNMTPWIINVKVNVISTHRANQL